MLLLKPAENLNISLVNGILRDILNFGKVYPIINIYSILVRFTLLLKKQVVLKNIYISKCLVSNSQNRIMIFV